MPNPYSPKFVGFSIQDFFRAPINLGHIVTQKNLKTAIPFTSLKPGKTWGTDVKNMEAKFSASGSSLEQYQGRRDLYPNLELENIS